MSVKHPLDGTYPQLSGEPRNKGLYGALWVGSLSQRTITVDYRDFLIKRLLIDGFLPVSNVYKQFHQRMLFECVIAQDEVGNHLVYAVPTGGQVDDVFVVESE